MKSQIHAGKTMQIVAHFKAVDDATFLNGIKAQFGLLEETTA